MTLREGLKKLGLTQEWLADQLSLRQASISNWVRRRCPPPDVRRRIQELLGGIVTDWGRCGRCGRDGTRWAGLEPAELRELVAVLEEADAPGGRLKQQRKLLAEMQRELGTRGKRIVA